MAKNSKVSLSDYRDCKWMTKERLALIAEKCGSPIENYQDLSKAELIELTKKAQQAVINSHGKLYEGEY